MEDQNAPNTTMLKVLLIGSTGVGKTAFLLRYVNPEDEFSENLSQTVGIDFRVQTIERQSRKISLQIWDTAGQERYRSITTAYFRGAHGFLVMYDVTKTETFEAVNEWVEQINKFADTTPNIILVANKIDLTDARVVTTSEGEELANTLGAQYCETSVKDNTEIMETINLLLDEILKGIKDEDPAQKPPEMPSKGANENDEESEEDAQVEEKESVEEVKEEPEEPIKLAPESSGEKVSSPHEHGKKCFC